MTERKPCPQPCRDCPFRSDIVPYQSGYLIWLIWFWPFDFAACIVGNWMKYLFMDLPHLIGSLVYNIVKAQFEQIARNFLK